jgi:hypothetical protein
VEGSDRRLVEGSTSEFARRYSGKLKKKNSINIQYPGQDSNRGHPEYKPETLPLEITCSVNVTFEQVEYNLPVHPSN